MSRRNRFKETIRAGRPAVAMWVTTPWIGTPDILGAAGVDAAFIDLEHVSYDVLEAERLVIASESAGISPLVRPAGLDPSVVSRLLDAGAHGIVFPQIESEADAELAVRYTRYRPEGVRGWGGAHTRFAGWHGGYAGDLYGDGDGEVGVYTDAYVATANEFPAVVLIVETALGVERIDEIAGAQGVDALIFGWGDFAVESGFDVEACKRAAAATYEAARRHGVGVALNRGDAFYPGCFAIAGVDSLHMSNALTEAVRAARAEVGAPIA